MLALDGGQLAEEQHRAIDCEHAVPTRWAAHHDGLLIITFDEAGSDNTNGGGKVEWVVVSPKAKRGYQSTTVYKHQSTLRLILKGLGVTVFPGDAARAPDMTEFFTP
ncbi:MAG: hypothetical protein DMD36_07205 [Gemmatimonadetes bacterium]|nr:MAG: hypothetical protein DMD36_07205 [Gemmatimonadota bacterium]